MKAFDRPRFDHWGIPTKAPKPGETWLEASRVWVTNPRHHPAHVEFLRYEPTSSVIEFRRTNPHIAFRVADLERAINGLKVLTGPNVVANGFAKLAFVEIEGVVVELMQWPHIDYEGWFPEAGRHPLEDKKAASGMPSFERARFDHWGVPTSEPKPGEKWLEATRVWVTNPRKHPAHVEFLRYVAGSRVSEFRRTNPHIAFRVLDIEQAIKNLNVLTGPDVVANGFAKHAFVEVEGVVVQLDQWPDIDYEGWYPD